MNDPLLQDLIRILFGNALEGGVTEVSWEELPTLMAKLERAGFEVRGGLKDDGMGNHRPVVAVTLHIKVRGLRHSGRA